MDRESEEKEAEERAKRREIYKHEWTELSDLPDSTYDPQNGWRLDQFAMRFEPDLLREHKEFYFQLYHPKQPRKPFDPFFLVDQELERAINKRLVDPCFQVKGFRPDAFEAEIVPIPLLEQMFPIIETSELLDINRVPARRRYDHVRVFELSQKFHRGRPPTYDWPALVQKIQNERLCLSSEAELIRYCRNNVQPALGKRRHKDGPDDKTIREAITKHRLDKFVAFK